MKNVLQDEAILITKTSGASSTQIRNAIRKQASLEFLDDKVETYLRDHGKEIGGIYKNLSKR